MSNDQHQLGVYGDKQLQIEGLDPNFIKNGLYLARQKTIQVIDEIKNSLLKFWVLTAI